MKLDSETVTLRDSTQVTIRPIRPDDAPRLQALHSRLSPETVRLRFLSVRPTLPPDEARQLATVDYKARMAFVATHEDAGEDVVVAVARYNAVQPERSGEAEAAIVVEDRYQGLGLGTLLLERLLAYARLHAIRAFVGEISAENERAMRFVRRSGLPTEKRLQAGAWEIKVKI